MPCNASGRVRLFIIFMFIMVHHGLDAIPRHYKLETKIKIGGRKLQSISDRIRFPDDYDQGSWKEEPACTPGSTLCESVDGYPHDLVDKVLSHATDFDKFFSADEDIDDTEMGGRFLEDSYLPLCRSQKKIMFPRWGVTTNNEYKFIANQDDNTKYVQAVKVEICTAEKAPCALYSQLPKIYSTSCQQRYVERKLVTVSSSGVELGVDKFLIPTSCCCTYKKRMF